VQGCTVQVDGKRLRTAELAQLGRVLVAERHGLDHRRRGPPPQPARHLFRVTVDIDSHDFVAVLYVGDPQPRQRAQIIDPRGSNARRPRVVPPQFVQRHSGTVLHGAAHVLWTGWVFPACMHA